MLIGELSKRSGLSRDTIRYYEKLGLLVIENRNPGSTYKNYGNAGLRRLGHIKRLKAVGFTLREIRAFLGVTGEHHPCQTLPAQLADKIGKLDEQVAALLAIKDSLVAVSNACDAKCATKDGLPTCIPVTDGLHRGAKRC